MHRTKTLTTALRISLVALILTACGQSAPTAQTPGAGQTSFVASAARQWRLPDELREISGLAVTADGRVFGHDDERAIIYQIDVARGALVKAFSVGEPVRGDFEGLAIGPSGEFWLITSNGRLYRFEEGESGARVDFEQIDTGLGEICEIEGLAYLAAEESLIVACKENHAQPMRDTVSLHAWRLGAQEATPWRDFSMAELARAAQVSEFHPSGLEFDARDGRLVLISANAPALAEISSNGAIVAARRLRGHRQPEGVAVLSDGALILADEGGNGRALLSRYGPAS